MSGPINKYAFKGLEIADWGNEKFSIRKSFKKKGDTEFTEYKIPTIFKNELEELGKLIAQALGSESIQPEQPPAVEGEALPANEPIPFDDEDIPF